MLTSALALIIVLLWLILEKKTILVSDLVCRLRSLRRFKISVLQLQLGTRIHAVIPVHILILSHFSEW